MEENLTKAIDKETDADLFYMMSLAQVGMQKYNPGNLIMTDDKAPVELLGMKVIDELISDEVAYYKKIFNEEGIEGLTSLILREVN